jgi:hypothetical protein
LVPQSFGEGFTPSGIYTTAISKSTLSALGCKAESRLTRGTPIQVTVIELALNYRQRRQRGWIVIEYGLDELFGDSVSGAPQQLFGSIVAMDKTRHFPEGRLGRG